jgi:hypothetical protein
MNLHAALNHFFGKAEEINGANRCPTYLYRWVLASVGETKVYLHKFVGSDWSRDLHDHPKRFVSIGIWGAYMEETPTAKKKYNAPWIRTFPAEHKHRLTTPWGTCWTIVIVGKPKRMWGFWPGGRFVPWRDYVSGSHSAVADENRDC